ncbi:hypothetical protein BD408DRAFT_485850 [Parasitella parasitica]|nr:hypothetical protein BD408DRAFT_485850 [Parasitella parasitica]
MPKKAKGIFVQSINVVVSNRKNWFQLVSYCRQLIAYYKFKDTTSAFDAAWTLRMQKQHALDLEHNPKKAISHIQQIKTRCLDTERLLAALANLIKIIDTNVFLLNPDNKARANSAMNRHVDPENCLDANSWLLFARPTFYDPSRDQISLAVLPAGLFGTANTASVPSVPSSPHRTDLEPDLEPDEYGWVAMENGLLFYNVYAGIAADCHPFDKEA